MRKVAVAERERHVDSLDRASAGGEISHLHAVPSSRSVGPYERYVKPTIDRIAGVTLTVITAPFVVVIIPLIWRRMGRPAIFRQQRIGRGGECFTVYKFRTMDHDRRLRSVQFEGDDRRVNHKSSEDPRHTDLGRFLRKWSLDEIPQFWNVARGEMSIVGPRPELPSIVEAYEPWQHRRHDVKPGLTGRWQVSARGDVPMHQATDVDIAYVENLRFIEDVRIVLRTPRAMLGSNKGH